MRKALYIIFGTALIAGVVVLCTDGYYIFTGAPRIADLESRWWGGYYHTVQMGRQRCVARFAKGDAGLEMALISSWGSPVIFHVIRTTPSREFVNLRFIGPKNIQIEAKQLYAGKRYFIKKLSDGRFEDFWRKNEDITIRGKSDVSAGSYIEIAIEPLTDREMKVYWKKYVRPDLQDLTPGRILEKIGFNYK